MAKDTTRSWRRAVRVLYPNAHSVRRGKSFVVSALRRRKSLLGIGITAKIAWQCAYLTTLDVASHSASEAAARLVERSRR